MLQQLYNFYISEYPRYIQYQQAKEKLDALLNQFDFDISKLYDSMGSSIISFVEELLPNAQAQYNLWLEKKKELTIQFQANTEAITKNSKLSEFYKQALDNLTTDYLTSLSSMLTEVYTSVYQKDNKRIFLGMEDYRGKKVIKLYLINHVDGRDYKEPLENDGGSAQIMLGLIIAIYYILTTGAPRFIYIDESFGALHDDVLARFCNILQRFVNELDFTFLIVDHSPTRMQEFIDKAYYVKQGEYQEFTKETLDDFFTSISKREL